MAKRTPATNAWDAIDIAAEDRLTENQAAPVVRYSAFKRKAQVRMLKWSIFIGVPVALLASMVAVSNAHLPTAKSPSITSVSVNTSPGKPAANAAVSAWLASKPSPLPGGKVLSWDGFETLPKPKLSDQQKHNQTGVSYRTEVDYFTLSATTSSGDPVFYSTSVEVLIAPGGVTTVSGTPTLLPELPNGSINITTTWPGYNSFTPSGSVDSAVQSWAKAFSSGDSDTLRIAIGDRSSHHAYMPLSGVSATNVSITAGGAKPNSTGGTNQSPSTILARVTMGLKWSSGKKSDNDHIPTATYDVLIKDADTGSPRVVAWGGAGSGPSLHAYGNAVSASLVQNGTAGSSSDSDDDGETSSNSSDGSTSGSN